MAPPMTYPTTPVDLTPDLEDALEETGATRALASLKRAHAPKLPKPTLNDIMELKAELEPTFEGIHAEIDKKRDLRYMREEAAEKIAKDQSFGLPVHTRLSHNEGMRLSALATRNPPKGKIAPAGDGPQAIARADKQTRWGNQLINSFERRVKFPLWRQFCDKVMNDGLGALEIYYCGGEAYDDPKQYKAQQVAGDDGDYRDETPREIKRRTEEALMSAQMPIGLRVIDGMSLLFPPWGDEGIEQILIVEKKTKRQVRDEQRKRLSGEAMRAAEAPKAGDWGTPILSGGSPSGRSWDSFSANPKPADRVGDIETIRYYDKEWYAYIVDGKFEVEPVAHRLPELPVYVCLGQVTGSPNLSELAQGITWGMGELERALDLLLSIAVDNALANRDKLRVFIEQGADTGVAVTAANATMDIKDPNTAKRLNPGEKAYSVAMFESVPDESTTGFLMQLYQRSGQNPVAQGQVPGANTPGYVMNSATAATNSLYESALDNLANAAAWITDFSRQCVKSTVKEKVYQSVPQKGGGKAIEMLGVGPDDITDVPSSYSIDPLDDINRAAILQGLMNAMEKGLVPREVVQEEGLGAEDPQLWDDMITMDAAKQSLAAMVVQMALMRVQAIQQQQQQPVGAGGGAAAPQPSGVGSGGMPASPRPPTAGAANAAASQQAYGEPGMNGNAAMSGQASVQNQGVPG